MATEPDLKDVFRGIEASDDEMVRYRARLANALATRPTYFSTRGRWLVGTGLATLSAAAAALFFLVPRVETPTLRQQTLEEVRRLVAVNSTDDELARLTEQANKGGRTPLERHNALLVRALVGAPAETVDAAVAGAKADPRAEVRAFYLDLLLDRADEWLIDSESVAELMDIEPDPLCLALLGQILKVAARTCS